MKIVTTYQYHLRLLVVVIIAYCPLAFFQSTLLHDDIDVALSTKYFAGECLQQGFLPLWNPYQIWGFPAHADLQYTNWNLETLLAGILYGYDYVVLHIFFIFYLFLAALGAFLLARHLSKNSKTAFYIACVYVLSGLVTAHVQSLVTILGLVWLPYVVLYFLKWLSEANLKHTLALCFFSYLLMTLGYQAFVFMLLPPFLLLLAHQFVADYKAGNGAAIKQKLITGTLALLILLVLLLPVLVTQFQAKPFVARLNGMSVQEVMMNPFSPQSMVSLINPILTIGHDDWFHTEVTMRNLFLGTIPLLLIFISFFKRNKSAVEIILLSVAFIYLLGSFGDAIPVRKLMYYILPGFKLFRFPSLLRVVAILLLLCYWALNADKSIAFFYEQKRKRNTILLVAIAVHLFVACFCFVKLNRYAFFNHFNNGFHEGIGNSNPLEIAFYLSISQLIIMSLSLILFNRAAAAEKLKNRLIFITITEMATVVLLYGQFTAFSSLKPNDIQGNFSRMQKGFPFPSKDALKDIRYKTDNLQHLWKNTGAFKKQLVNDDAWTSFYFSNYDKLGSTSPALKDSLLSYPFVYLSLPLTNERVAAIPVDTSTQFIQQSFHFRNAEADMQYTAFSPHNISLNIKTEKPIVLNLQQSYYTGWTVKVDDLPQTILWNAGFLMSVAVPKGLHTISFSYSNSLFQKSIAVSYMMLVLIVLACIMLSSWLRAKKQAVLLLFFGCSLAVVAVFFKHSGKKAITVTNGFTYDYSNSTTYYDFNSKQDIAAAIASLKNNKPKNIRYSWSNYDNAPELLYALGIKADAIAAEQKTMNGQISYQLNDYAVGLQKLETDTAWKDKSFMDTTGINAYALKLNETQNPYSKTIAIGSDKLKQHNLYGFVQLKAEQFSEPMIVCHIKHSDGTEQSLYFNLNKYLLHTNDWETIPWYFHTENLISPKDKINLFMMNVKNPNVFVKKVSVQYFEPTAY